MINFKIVQPEKQEEKAVPVQLVTSPSEEGRILLMVAGVCVGWLSPHGGHLVLAYVGGSGLARLRQLNIALDPANRVDYLRVTREPPG